MTQYIGAYVPRRLDMIHTTWLVSDKKCGVVLSYNVRNFRMVLILLVPCTYLLLINFDLSFVGSCAPL